MSELHPSQAESVAERAARRAKEIKAGEKRRADVKAAREAARVKNRRAEVDGYRNHMQAMSASEAVAASEADLTPDKMNTPDKLEGKTKAELLALAKAHGVKLPSGATKAEILAILSR